MTRKSKRELARDVEDLELEEPDVAGWISLLSGDELEAVPGHPEKIRVDGDLKRLSSQVLDTLREGS